MRPFARPNYFNFVAPKGVVIMDLVPDYAGVFEWVPPGHGQRRGHINLVRNARRLHKDPMSSEKQLALALKMGYKYWDREGMIRSMRRNRIQTALDLQAA